MQRRGIDIEAFARGYLEEMRDTSRDSIEFWEQLDDLIRTDPETAWQVLLELSKRATIYETGRLGAGPLEQLLVEHDQFAHRAALAALTNETFKSMLACVTTRGMSPEMERIIRTAIE